MVNDLLELVGFVLVVAAAFLVAPALALVVAGAGLMVKANLRSLQPRDKDRS